jgi:N-acyl-L-homoserine lactone synthetase
MQRTAPLNQPVFSIGYISCREDYERVLRLRFDAYRHAGKLHPDVKLKQMSDEFDARSAIVVARKENQIVGSVRVIFHGAQDPLSYGRYFPEPLAGLPTREEYAEASRLCIDRKYRGQGLFEILAEEMATATARRGRRYIVGGSTAQLLRRWEKCGFSGTGHFYKSGDIAGLEHQIIVMDLRNRVSTPGKPQS